VRHLPHKETQPPKSATKDHSISWLSSISSLKTSRRT